MIAGNIHAATKIDPLFNIMKANPSFAVSNMKAFGTKAISGTTYTEALIRASDVEAAKKLITSVGGNYRSVIKNFITASIPLSSLDTLNHSDAIIYIETARPMRMKMNDARIVSRVAEVQDGTGTGTAYDGTGVIVGVIDSGLDCAHADFNDADGDSRVLAYWDQTISGDGVSEIDSSNGTEYTGSTISDGTCVNSPDATASGDDGGHGTHVAGIAAGNDATYRGVAPDANIIGVKLYSVEVVNSSYDQYLSTLSTYVIDAVNYVFKKAQSLGKPAVVNLSIGTSLGPHDGESSFEAALDALLIESGTTEKQGRAIVNAAGNENALILDNDYAGGIHAAIDVSTGSPKAFEILAPYISEKNPVGAIGGVYIDIWLESTSSCSISMNAYNKSKTTLNGSMSAITAGESNASSPSTDGTVSMSVDFSDDANANNGKQHAVGLITATSSTAMFSYSFDLVFTGECDGDAWLYYDYVYFNLFTKGRADLFDPGVSYTYVDGDSNSTMTIPATANNVIAVGSFLGRDEWIDANDTTHSQEAVLGGTTGDISTFSSLGPTADGRTKPEIAAPGEPIISTLVSNNTISNSSKGDATHWKLQGTSMAAPHITGIVALMLEKNGCLTPTQIKNYIIGSADSDVYTGSSLPNNEWGYGKIDAVEALNSVTATDCTPSNDSEEGTDDGDDDDDSTASSSGCSNIGNGGPGSASILLFVLTIPLLYIARKRSSKTSCHIRGK